MTNAVAKKQSLFRVTINIIQSTAKEWWPWVLIFGLFFAALQICIMQSLLQSPMMHFAQQHPEMHADPQNFAKTHPELAKQYGEIVKDSLMGFWVSVLPYLAIIGLLDIVAVYIFAVIVMSYLRPRIGLRHSANGFFYWLGKGLWKFFRPILWCLIPIAGGFIYLRSLIRYAAVSPLALLREGDELKTSWAMTKGNWWRIFGNQILLVIALGFVSLVIVQVLNFLVLLMTGGREIPAILDIMAFVQGMMMGVGVMAGAAFSCAVYEVLTSEGGAK